MCINAWMSVMTIGHTPCSVCVSITPHKESTRWSNWHWLYNNRATITQRDTEVADHRMAEMDASLNFALHMVSQLPDRGDRRLPNRLKYIGGRRYWQIVVVQTLSSNDLLKCTFIWAARNIWFLPETYVRPEIVVKIARHRSDCRYARRLYRKQLGNDEGTDTVSAVRGLVWLLIPDPQETLSKAAELSLPYHLVFEKQWSVCRDHRHKAYPVRRGPREIYLVRPR
ncbi:predicted protein [Postia placenta Mad-698-R]|nr:predicted protein [Postia placenta Mad-698-R]